MDRFQIQSDPRAWRSTSIQSDHFFFFYQTLVVFLWGITVVNLSVFNNLIIMTLYLRKHFFGFYDK